MKTWTAFRTAIVAAANSAVVRIPAVLPAAANARVIEGQLSVPYGLWPIDITNEEGKPERVLQRLNKSTAERLVAAFSSLRGRFARYVSGCNIYMGHPDSRKAIRLDEWKAIGRCTAVEATDAAFVGVCELPDETKTLLAANEKLAPSPFWGLVRTRDVQAGLAIFEPIALYSWGITPRPNIPGAAANEDPTVAEDVQVLQDSAARDQELAVLAAEIADMEARLSAAETARYTREQEVIARDASIAEMRATIEQLRAEVAAARTRLETEVRATVAGVTAANESRDVALGAIVDAAIAARRICKTDREVWITKLRSTPAAANELYVPMKTESVLGARRVEASNAAQDGTGPSVTFASAVRARMDRTHEDWATAWVATKSTHSDVFKLMR